MKICGLNKIIRILYGVCGCRSKSVPGNDLSTNSSGTFSRVSSFVFNTCVLFVSDMFSRDALIPMRSPHSEEAVTLIASRQEEALIDPTANSILVNILAIAVKFAFWILFSTMSTILRISLPIFLLKHLSKVCTFSKLWLVVTTLPILLTVVS